MNEQIVLIILMGSLAIIEIAMIVSIFKLRNTLLKINDKVKKFETKVDGVTANIRLVYDLIKPTAQLLENGELEVHGKTPIGDVNLKLNMSKGGKND